MDPNKLEKYLVRAVIFFLGSIAVTLGSLPLLFRHIFVFLLVLLLIVTRILPRLNTYSRVLDALFIFVIIWYLPYLSLYKNFLTEGKKLFEWTFGANEAVSHVAANSLSGLFWILLPISLVVLERDSLKSIFFKIGKKEGWIAGTVVLLLLVAVAFYIALRSPVEFKVYISLLPLGLAFAGINSFKEEVLYRGLIFGRTLQFGFVYALFCQFIWFALIHVLYSGAAVKSIGMFMGVGFFSMLAAWLIKIFDSLACPILIHAGIDLIIFVSSVPQYINQ